MVMTAQQVEAVRGQIMTLTAGSTTISSVEISEVDGVEGTSVLVTVRIADEGGAPWDADDFRSIRRRARTTVLEAIGAERDVRLIYESDSPGDDDEPSVDDAGGKHEPHLAS